MAAAAVFAAPALAIYFVAVAAVGVAAAVLAAAAVVVAAAARPQAVPLDQRLGLAKV